MSVVKEWYIQNIAPRQLYKNIHYMYSLVGVIGDDYVLYE